MRPLVCRHQQWRRARLSSLRITRDLPPPRVRSVRQGSLWRSGTVPSACGVTQRVGARHLVTIPAAEPRAAAPVFRDDDVRRKHEAVALQPNLGAFRHVRRGGGDAVWRSQARLHPSFHHCAGPVLDPILDRPAVLGVPLYLGYQAHAVIWDQPAEKRVRSQTAVSDPAPCEERARFKRRWLSRGEPTPSSRRS
jgi:hypothetical protein